MTPAQKALRAKIASAISWAHTTDRTARTQAARDKRLENLESQVDPDGQLPADERRRRALELRRAQMLQMSLKSSQARAKRVKE